MLLPRVFLSQETTTPELPFSSDRVVPTSVGMNTMACRAVAQAALSAGTASADDEQHWPLLLVAGWLTTAADLMLEAGLLRP